MMGWSRPSVPARTVSRGLLSLAVLALVLGQAALAGPVGEEVVHGTARFAREGALTTIHAGDKAIIQYQSFDVASAETVRFVQPGALARVLNRISGAAPTQIDGALQANGIVYFVNPAGVRFGPSAIVDVGQIVAAAGNLSNADFLNGVNHFTDLSGEVVNWGTISAGAASLVGQRVANYGSIVAPGGLIAMVAGDDVLLTQHGSQMMVKIAGGGGDGPGVENAGQALAPQGSVTLGAGDLYSLAVRNVGTVEGSRITVEGGAVEVGGTLDASATDGVGGTVKILGDKVALLGAQIDASGATGGGTVLVGGDYQGGGAVRTASRTYVGPNATIKADALLTGGGGTVIVWSNTATGCHGHISARGGAASGDGGFVEISGARSLVSRGTLDLRAPNGAAGTVLYDPENIEIVGGSSDGDDNPDASAANIEGGGTAGLVDYGDEGAGSPDPFLIYESEIEGTDASIILRSRSGIVVSGTFNNDGDGAGADDPGTGVLLIKPNRSLTLETRNRSDLGDTGAGINLTGATVEIKTTGTGDVMMINFATDIGTDAGGPIVVGKITAGGSIEIDSTESVTVGDTLTAGGDIDLWGGIINLNAPLLAGGAVGSDENNLVVNVAAPGLIQNGIDVAAAGATITVADGTYDESLLIDTASLTIQSVNGSAATTVNLQGDVGGEQASVLILGGASGLTLGGAPGKGFGFVATAATARLLQVQGSPDPVAISYNTFDSTANGMTATINVSEDTTNHLTIAHNTFTTADGDGAIWAPKVLNLTVDTNIFNGPGKAAAGGGYAIETCGVGGTSSIAGNIINDYPNGIFILSGYGGTTGLSIPGNTVSDCARGIRFIDASAYGYGAGDIDGVTIGGSAANSNTLTGNDIGLRLGDGAAVLADTFTVTHNSFNANAIGVQSEHATRVLDLQSNDFLVNTDKAVNVTGAAGVTAESNWWSSVNGPAHPDNSFNVGSQGDAASGTLDFAPWLDGPFATGGAFAPIAIGATGYGSIQDAIDNANPLDTLTVAAGSYTEDLTVNVDVTIQGAGVASTTLTNTTASPPHVINASGVTFDGFTFDEALAATAEVFFLIDSSAGAIANTTFSNNIFNMGTDDVGIHFGAYSVANNTISNTTITANAFTNADDLVANPIRVGHPGFNDVPVTTLELTGNTVTGGTCRIYIADEIVSGVNIHHNDFVTSEGTLLVTGSGPGATGALDDFAFENNAVLTGNGYGVAFGVTADGLDDANFTGYTRVRYNGFEVDGQDLTGWGLTGTWYAVNSKLTTLDPAQTVLDCSGNWWNATTAAGVGDQIVVDSAGVVDYTPWLDSDFDDSGATVGFVPHFSSVLYVDAASPQAAAAGGPKAGAGERIQEAVDLSPARIAAEDGTYTGDLVIANDLWLYSATGRDNTTIQLDSNAIGIDVQCTDFELGGTDQGFTVLPGATTVTLVQTADGGSPTISNCAFDTTGAATTEAVRLGTGSQFAGVYDSNFTLGDDGDSGILVTNAVSPWFEGNVITGPAANPANGYGIAVFGAVSAVSMTPFYVENNIITNVADAIYASNGDGTDLLTIRGNQIDGASRGINIQQFTPVGVPGDMTLVEITGNTVTNSTVGLLVGDGAHILPAEITIQNNTFNTNTVGLRSDHATGVVALDHNDFAGNTTFAVQANGAAAVNAEDNWWGSANGPVHTDNNTFNVGSQGDRVSDNVDFTPWLEASFTAPGTSFAPITNVAQTSYHASIQDAVDNAAPGNEIRLAEGTFTEDFAIDKGLTLTKEAAAARDNVIIQGVDSLPWASFPLADPNIDVQADSVTISDVTIQAPLVPTGEYSSGVVLNGQGNSITGCKLVAQGTGDGGCVLIQTYRDDVLGFDSDVTGLSVTGNTFEGTPGGGYVGVFINHQGVAVSGGDTVTVATNTMTGNIAQGIVTERSETAITGNSLTTSFTGTSRGIMVQDFVTPANVLDNVAVTGNTIDGFDIGLRIGLTGQTVTNLTVTGNTFQNNDLHVQDRVGATDPTALLAANTVTGAVLIERSSVLLDSIWSTIQGAIDDAIAADRILPQPDSYAEDLTIDKGVTVDGDGAATLNSQHTIIASGVTLTGFTLNGGGSETLVTIDSTGGAIDNTTISDNTFNLDTDDVGIAIGAEDTNNNLISNTTITSNTFSGPPDQSAHSVRVGGPLQSGFDVPVDGLTFRCNTTDRATLYLYIIDENVQNVAVTGNDFTNTWGALYITGDAGSAATSTGTLTDFTFSNNFVAGTNGFGVAIDLHGDSLDDDNLPSPETIQIVMNSFDGVSGETLPAGSFKAVGILATGFTGTIDARLNWYGVATAGGVAGEVSANVDYSPWLGTDVSVVVYDVTDQGDTDGPAYDFEDISSTGTPLALTDDDNSGLLPLGFDLDFFGTDYPDVVVSSNGYLVFDLTDPNNWSPDSIPDIWTPNGLIAGWWSDLDPTEGAGTVHYEVRGAQGSRRYIVQYTDVEHWLGGDPSTFQVKLFEGTHVIETHYQSAQTDGATVTVGIENQEGTRGHQYYRGSANLPSSTAVRYTPAACGFHPDLSVLHVDDASPQVGATGGIQEGHDNLLAGGTLHVHAGTYTDPLGTTKPFTMNLPDGPVILDTPGPAVFGDETAVTGAQDLTFTNDVLGAADFLIQTTGDLIFQPAAGIVTTINVAGNAQLGGDLAAPPDRATVILQTGGVLDVTAGGDLTIGRNQMVSVPYATGLSVLSLVCGDTLSCTDLNAGILNLAATTISVWQRGVINTLRADNSTERSFATELIGLDAFTAAGTWQAIGTGLPPVLATRVGTPAFAPPGFNIGTLRLRGGAADAELRGLVPPIQETALDLIADGGSRELSSALASAIPHLETVEVVPEQVELSAALRELLEQLGIFAREPGAGERGAGTFDDLIAKPPSEWRSEDHTVAATRLHSGLTRRSVGLYRSIFWREDQYQAAAIKATLQKALAHCKAKHKGEKFDPEKFRRCLEAEAACKDALAVVGQLRELFQTVGMLGLNRVEQQISERIIVRDIIPRGLSGRDLIATIKGPAS